MFDTLLTQHRDVSQRSKTLYSSCEQIVKEKEQLEEFADALKAKLRCVLKWHSYVMWIMLTKRYMQ